MPVLEKTKFFLNKGVIVFNYFHLLLTKPGKNTFLLSFVGTNFLILFNIKIIKVIQVK